MKNNTLTLIQNQRFGEERALYAARNLHVLGCAFDGEEDGESALKESAHVTVENTLCNLRYPFWHDDDLTLIGCSMTELCRASLWYSRNVSIRDCKMHGTKALRECENVAITGSDILSAEFGWSTRGVSLCDSVAQGEYFMLRAEDISMKKVQFKGKYSFQYVKNAVIEDCELDTKDAFWHAENVTVKNCTVKGEYLAWYSKDLTLINCRIIGTQPLCYCKGLKLIDCEMIDTYLAFERSEVEATVTTPIVSIKNAYAGYIKAPAAELIRDDENANCVITLG